MTINCVMASELELLRSFIGVYRAASITKAAPSLNLTQPAVSGHIKALEAQLGRVLFTRTPRGTVPTQAAHDLARGVASHLDAVTTHVATARAGGPAPAGYVYLGGPAEFLNAKVLPALAVLCEQRIGLRVRFGLPDDLITSVSDGSLDLAVATRRVRRRGVEYESLAHETFVLVGVPRWAAAIVGGDRGGVDVTSLADVPLIAYSEELPVTERYYREVFGADVPEPAVLVPDLRSVVAVALAGAGIAAVPRYLCEQQLARRELIEIARPRNAPTNEIFIAWKTGTASPRREAALAVLRRTAPHW